MGNTDHTITLFSAQAEIVINILERDGVCFSKRAYVERKYGESAPIFVAAYDWFVQAAQKYLPKPVGAEYPYWAFLDLYSVEQSGDSHTLQLRVPTEEAVFFDMYDWNKVMRLQYIGETETDEKRFKQMLADHGIRRESDVILTNFHPDLRFQVQDSWQRLFRHHERVKAGDTTGVQSVQAGLWQLKSTWQV